MTSSRLFLLFVYSLLSTAAFAQADLALSLRAANAMPDVYTTFTVDLVVYNEGTAPASSTVSFLVPATLTFVGGNEGFATQGNFSPYGGQWTTDVIAPGDSATLYMQFYNRSGVAKQIYAQVEQMDVADADSTPGNGRAPTVAEDDEALIVINGEVGPVCVIDIFAAVTPCDDQGTTDPADDAFDLRVEVQGAVGDTALVTIAGTTRALAVGEVWTLPGQLISDGAIAVLAEAAGLAGCTISQLVQTPQACSDPSTGGCSLNLLENGDFEQSTFPQGWSLLSFRSFSNDTVASTGSRSLVFTDEAFSGAYQTIDAIPGQPYDLTALIQKASPLLQASVQLKFLSASYQIVGRELLSLNALDQGFHTITLSALAPANARFLEVRFERYDGFGDFLIDDVCLQGAGTDPCSNDEVVPDLQFCPQDVVAQAPAGVDSISVSWVPPFATDNCTDEVSITSTHQPGDEFAIGTTEVRYTATDDAGNINTCRFDVEVLGTTGGGPVDLSISRISPPFSLRPGRTTRVFYFLDNAGTEPVPAGVIARSYVSVDPVLSADDIALSSMSLAGAPVGRTEFDLSITVPTGLEGNYFIIIRVDDTNTLAETNENNNTRSVGTRISAFCFAESDFPWHEWISEVSFGDFTNLSDKSTYTRYTSQSIQATTGQALDYAFETSYSYATSAPHYSVYLDQDGDAFLEQDELWFQTSDVAPPNGAGATQRTEGSMALPAGLGAGTYVLRVIMRRDAYAVRPCSRIDFGEIEDYLLTVSETQPLRLSAKGRASGAGLLQAAPNPAIDYLEVRAPLLDDQEVTLTFVDQLGRPVYQLDYEHRAGEAQRISLPVLPAGLYAMHLQPTRGSLLSSLIVIGY